MGYYLQNMAHKANTNYAIHSMSHYSFNKVESAVLSMEGTLLYFSLPHVVKLQNREHVS